MFGHLKDPLRKTIILRRIEFYADFRHDFRHAVNQRSPYTIYSFPQLPINLFSHNMSF